MQCAHGVLAARSAWRSEVTPDVPQTEQGPDVCLAPLCAKHSAVPSRWRTWASLLWRVFGAEGWRCPNCSQKMRLRTVVLGPTVALRIIAALDLAARAPPADLDLAS